jgi:radical SAM superfamily enzyme YgiQ (UPF0313 family)
MRILFYHPTSHSDGFPEPPLGLGYLMSIAKKNNLQYEFYDEDHHSKFFSLNQVVRQFNPGLYAISFMTPQYYEVSNIIRKMKEWTPGAKIIVGGPHVSALPKETLEELESVDYVCKGEGEKTFEDFLLYLQGRKRLDDIPGLFYRKDDGIYSNPPRELMKSTELEQYHIDWEKIMEHGQYEQKLVYMKEPQPALSVITTRGCPFQCTFCDEGNIWKRKVRMRTIDDVINEIIYLIQKYRIEHFNILDDTFTLVKSRVLEFCEKVKPLNIKFRITAKTTTVDEELLSSLKEAGCQIVAFGVESGDDEVLRIMKKKQTTDDIKKAFRLCKKVGISSYALCMVGNIGEDMNAVKKTARLIREISPDLFSCTIMTPYPGSENYKICKANGWILNENWEYWVPSILKTKEYKLVSRTDKMDEKTLMRAYYFMNRYVLLQRFKSKYGLLFIISPLFYMNEVFPRLKIIGFRSFVLYLVNIFLRRQN